MATSTTRKRYQLAGQAPRKAGLYRPIGFPDRMRLRLRYSDLVQIQSTSPATTVVNFQANNLFSVRTGGHQPMYFDTVMGIYNHYVVHASNVKVTLSQSVTSGGKGGIAAVFLNDDTSVVPTEILGIAEQSSAHAAQVAPFQNETTVSMYCSYSAVRVFGPNPIQNQELKGDAAANCSDTVVYSVCYQSVNGDTEVDAFVTIDYDVEFFELKDQIRN